MHRMRYDVVSSLASPTRRMTWEKAYAEAATALKKTDGARYAGHDAAVLSSRWKRTIRAGRGWRFYLHG